MAGLFLTSSLRQILPRVEIRRLDRRPGEYPTLSKTGDRTRTGRNNVFFDDGRTVVFHNGVSIVYPTTFRGQSDWVGSDLTGTLGAVTGNVVPSAVEQFVRSRCQTENPGPFIDCSLFEQDETNVVNSKFMTGVAYSIAPDRFSSKLSDKTIIRLEMPLSTVSQLSSNSSSIHYLSPNNGKFEKIADEVSWNANNANGSGQMPYPASVAPILFTPYGHHLLPLKDQALAGSALGGVRIVAGDGDVNEASTVYNAIVSYAGDTSDPYIWTLPLDGRLDESEPTNRPLTASLINSRHRAHLTQTLDLSNVLSAPFLLEKVVVEMPFQAGEGWLNDRFEFREIYDSVNDAAYFDVGGPMITCALLRQDKAGGDHRDLIASATITCANDVALGNYNVLTSSYLLYSGSLNLLWTDVFANPVGTGYFISASNIISGTVVSGSTNTYTGSLRMVMEPSVTSHAWRMRTSGSSYNFFNNLIDPVITDPHVGFEPGWGSRNTQAIGVLFGPTTKRSARYLESGRSAFGSDKALIEKQRLSGRTNPILAMDSQYENLPSVRTGSTQLFKSKVYSDVVSKTQKNPYVLYPKDSLVLCLSKHRAVGLADYTQWTMASSTLYFSPKTLSSLHDVAIPTGSVKITLYGDLIRTDSEFHDTLNQRLETTEAWQDVGDDPVLDQFDVTYANELSGSYIDRFNVMRAASSVLINGDVLTSSFETTRFYSNLADMKADLNQAPWSSQIEYPRTWSSARRISELRKRCRGVNHVSTNERFWDCRVPQPTPLAKRINPNFRIQLGIAGPGNLDTIYGTWTGTSLGGMLGSPAFGDVGIRDWMMTYPYEGKYEGLPYVFSDSIANTRGDLYFGPDRTGAEILIPQAGWGDVTVFVGDDSVTRFAPQQDDPIGGWAGGVGVSEFVRLFYGIGDGHSSTDNQHPLIRVKRLETDFFWTTIYGPAYTGYGIEQRGWRYGMKSGFIERSRCVFRRDHYGHPRDMLEQRLDTKYFDEIGLSSDGSPNVQPGVKDGVVQVRFYDQKGQPTEALRTLSSNVSFEATSSVPYTDGMVRNRPPYDASTLNIKNVVI